MIAASIHHDWQELRLRYCVTVNPPKSEVSRLSGNTAVSFVPMEAVGEMGGLRLDQTKTLDEVSGGYTYFRDGDILIAKITPCFENGKGAIAEGLENGIGFGTTELHVLRPSLSLDRRFLFYLTLSHGFRGMGTGSMYGAGGQKRVPDDFVRDFRHPIPSLPEQRAIAEFLDRETARIDALIEKKRRQIELLQERRAAVISRAVTKGLDPKAKMKPSGIEWLGEIPEHWRVRKLKWIAETQFSSVDKHAIEGEQPVRLCNYVDVYYHDHITSALDFMAATATPDEARRFEIKEGDVLVTKESEEWDDIAVPAFVSEQLDGVICGYHLALIRAKAGQIDGRFLFRAFSARGINDQFRVEATGITRYGLGKYGLDNALFPVPPIFEQRAIAAFLDRETVRIDALIGKIEKSIELLREHRSALISAAVTGKIDVRKEAAAC